MSSRSIQPSAAQKVSASGLALRAVRCPLEESAIAGTLHRRFTNVYRKEDGVSRLLIKQSTIFSME